MHLLASLALFAYLRTVSAHGDHGHDAPHDGESIAQYAERHMATEHHIDSFDLPSFFQLHDLNRCWDKEEIEAVYGVHHVYSQKKSKDDVEHQQKADHIVSAVLKLLDKNGDGVITLDELDKVGLEGLPNFDDLGAEGHHYDVESEFFLHHEASPQPVPHALPSSTSRTIPLHARTQTDESYNHPEDLEHFAHHEKIEQIEAEREAKYQGVSVEEVIAQHEPHEHEHDAPPPPPAAGEDPHLMVQDPLNDQLNPPPADAAGKKYTYTRKTDPDAEDPAARYAKVKAEADNQGEWGAGTAGYKPPKTPVEKMRKNMPYKYKFRRTWGDF
ncbi:precursor to secretory protein Ssp120 [Epithele typhae]|uniref:precursor to secretory protein Ssp120 n=1 Tax=Epithele typhae TaxID=378194 RepID=UPI0020077510|nr:precursor to secretory protein Ssp120 [Epithele typhae]KAH9920215.1 precursor to secretory protein Ssp120 [Epithele typhae]